MSIVSYLHVNLLNWLERNRASESRSVICHNGYNELTALAELHGSDKGQWMGTSPFKWPNHNYTDFYYQLLQPLRHSVSRVLEFGIGTSNINVESNMGVHGKPGASLRMWRDFFPSALIFGADVDSDALFQEDRISTFFFDQLDSKKAEESLLFLDQNLFDLVIDDGHHSEEAHRNTLKSTWKYLARGGHFFVEDVSPEQLPNLRSIARELGADSALVQLERRGLRLSNNQIFWLTKR